jgi:hypothetical protein
MEAIETRAERYLRYSHRGMVLLLVLMAIIGGGALAVILQPDGLIAGWMPRISVTIPVAIALIAGALVSTLGGDRWDPNAPEAQAILRDEWRRHNLARAMRVAFVIVLAAQTPLALWLASLPGSRAVIGMAIATMTLGMVTFTGLYLVFDREARDG